VEFLESSPWIKLSKKEGARMNKYQNMETSEINKRLEVLHKITQLTYEEKKELASLFAVISARSFSGRGY